MSTIKKSVKKHEDVSHRELKKESYMTRRICSSHIQGVTWGRIPSPWLGDKVGRLWHKVDRGRCVGDWSRPWSGHKVRWGYSQLRHRVPYCTPCFSLDSASEMEVTKIILTKVLVFWQLAIHKREFVRILDFLVNRSTLWISFQSANQKSKTFIKCLWIAKRNRRFWERNP